MVKTSEKSNPVKKINDGVSPSQLILATNTFQAFVKAIPEFKSRTLVIYNPLELVVTGQLQEDKSRAHNSL